MGYLKHLTFPPKCIFLSFLLQFHVAQAALSSSSVKKGGLTLLRAFAFEPGLLHAIVLDLKLVLIPSAK